jgi:hypothetical protein
VKEASHTRTTGASSLRLLPGIGRVDLADPSLPGRLAGKVSEQLELFAAEMRQGLLAASVAIGLEVMGELVAAEVAEVAGPKPEFRSFHEFWAQRQRETAAQRHFASAEAEID